MKVNAKFGGWKEHVIMSNVQVVNSFCMPSKEFVEFPTNTSGILFQPLAILNQYSHFHNFLE